MTAADIQAQVCAEFGITHEQMLSASRLRSIARPRQIAMWLIRHNLAHSLQRIGRAFGRDHTTVIHALAAVDRLIEADPWWAARVADLQLGLMKDAA